MSLQIVGCGPGLDRYLPRVARDVVRRCVRLLGRPQEMALFSRVRAEREEFDSWTIDRLERILLQAEEEEIALLVPGEGMNSPLLAWLRERASSLIGGVVPGIDPVSLECARLGENSARWVTLSTILGLDSRIVDEGQGVRPFAVCLEGHVKVSELADCLFRNRCANRSASVFRALGSAEESCVEQDLFGLLEDDSEDGVVLFTELDQV